MPFESAILKSGNTVAHCRKRECSIGQRFAKDELPAIRGGICALLCSEAGYLFQMPRWDRRLRIVLDWTIALFFRPDITD